jgi:hypothetical protein
LLPADLHQPLFSPMESIHSTDESAHRDFTLRLVHCDSRPALYTCSMYILGCSSSIHVVFV